MPAFRSSTQLTRSRKCLDEIICRISVIRTRPDLRPDYKAAIERIWLNINQANADIALLRAGPDPEDAYTPIDPYFAP